MSAMETKGKRTGLLSVLPLAGCLAAMAAPAPLLAADWRFVMADSGGERIELDRARIVREGPRSWAWSRISLGREVTDPNGPYNAIEALNSYDCERRQFTTQRRVYFLGEQPVRDEAAARLKPNNIPVGSIDEKLYNEACRPLRATEVARLAEAAAQRAQLASAADGAERPSPIHADLRTLDGGGGAQLMLVADAPAEKPRMIDLPKIDKEKAAAEAAAAGISTSKPAENQAAPSKPVPIGTQAQNTAAAASAAAASTAKPVAAPVLPKPVVKPAASLETGIGGHAREVMLATSGPRKAAKKEVNPAQEMHVHWGYDGAGAPANWAKIDAKNALCEVGKRQSPIDIRPGIQVDLEPIKFNYKPTKFRVWDNGHTIQVNVGAGSTIEVMGKRWELQQFHFHKPSEERINGRPYPMVAHFVHKDWDDNLAVIAVLLDEGPEHPALQTVWNNMPLEPNSEVLAGDVLEPIKLIPENRAYWTYMGSLTTPPCSENVLWMVMKTPTPISPEQIAIFARLYKNNARPVQPANGRLIKESR